MESNMLCKTSRCYKAFIPLEYESPNYDPRAKSGPQNHLNRPRSHFIQGQRHFVNIEK